MHKIVETLKYRMQVEDNFLMHVYRKISVSGDQNAKSIKNEATNSAVTKA